MFRLCIEIHSFTGILVSQVMSSTVLANSWDKQVVKDACETEPAESHKSANENRVGQVPNPESNIESLSAE